MQEHRRVLREYVDSRASFADLLAALEEHRTSAATPDPTALDALHILGEASTAGWADDDLRAELRGLLLAEAGVGRPVP